MPEKKAVLNVTVSESLAEDVRRTAAEDHTTISSIVERALAQQLAWELRRRDGLAAIDAHYQEHGYPTAGEKAAAEAWVDEADRLLDESRAQQASGRAGVNPGRSAG